MDLKLLVKAIEAANSKRRMIGVWSPTIAAAMWYLKETIPRFCVSEMASSWTEEGLEWDYPELVQRIREGMKRLIARLLENIAPMLPIKQKNLGERTNSIYGSDN